MMLLLSQRVRTTAVLLGLALASSTADAFGVLQFPSQSQRSSWVPVHRFSSAIAVNGDKSISSTTTQITAESAESATPNNNIRLNVNEKARTVTSVCTSGTLCTVSQEDGIQGAPFGSFVDYVLDDNGNPILLMNDMSMHTINIRKAEQPMVTLFTQLGDSSLRTEGQDVSRCSVTGTLQRMDPSDPDMDAVRMRYSIAHTYADQVMDSPKFAFYRLQPAKIYFVGGFGVLAKWVAPEDYHAAAPDILAKQAADIVNRVNRDHVEDLRLTAQHLLDVDTEIERIRMTSVDRLGMDIRVTSQMGSRRNKLQTDEFRIGFRIPVMSTEDAKSEILKVFQEAWEKGNGVSWGDNDPESPGANVPIMKIAADSLE